MTEVMELMEMNNSPWLVVVVTQSLPGITSACWYIPLASFFFELARVGTRTLTLHVQYYDNE